MNTWGPSLISAVVVILVNATLLIRADGKREGRILTLFDSFEKSLTDMKDTDEKQWDVINAHGERLSYVEAKINGKGH